jgi:DNA-binding NtrC family response regulator
MARLLDGKKVLVVDDERDVCDMIVDELSMCAVDTASSYDEARKSLAAKKYDLVILDIMGVRGHELLEEFAAKAPCIMLTAHALTPQDLKRSIVQRAVLYLPKEELGRLDVYAEKVLDPTGEDRQSLWNWLFGRLNFSRWFGKGWMSFDMDFFKDFNLTEQEVLDDLHHRERD